MTASGFTPFGMSRLALLLLATAAAQDSLLTPFSVDAPNSDIFPEAGLDPVRQFGPRFYTYAGPKQTNKFWANWAVEDVRTGAPIDHSIFVMPYALRWSPRVAPGKDGNKSEVAELAVSHNINEEVIEYDNGIAGPGHIQKYYTPFAREFSLGAVEQLGEFHEIISETQFGVHIVVNGPEGEDMRKITYPIFQGMVYVSGRYEGDITPTVSADGMSVVTKVSSGIWSFTNARGAEFRVYALLPSGDVVDDSFEFDTNGLMNKALDGWVRIARVQAEGDAAILDLHAGAVLYDWEMDVKEGGILEYTLTAQPGATDASKLIHFAYPHHVPLLTNERAGLSQMKTPTKGFMTAVKGNVWTITVDTSATANLPWLPSGEPIDSSRAASILTLAREDLADWESLNPEGKEKWKPDLLRDSFYWSGKGFQKLGSVCLMLEELAGPDDDDLARCTEILFQAFKCFYDVNADPTFCAGKPEGLYYDLAWGGAPTRNGFYPPGTNEPPCYDLDFGNACYNDHHYHYGYFVVAGAILVKLRPAMKDDALYVSFIQTLMRDTANPSAMDTYFPPFRCFDFFDFHSWSRGNMPDPDGKDQESTSEEINLLYGMILWGRIMGVPSVQSLSATMLSLEAVAINNYFLMRTGNTNHNPDFVKNHVTGIYFQNLVRYDTWFGRNKEFIHGIQMLPLSAALQLTRDADFCKQEWDDVLNVLEYNPQDAWSSLITTGSVALTDPETAWTRILAKPVMDSGLTWSYALYWTAVHYPPPPVPTPVPSPNYLLWGGLGALALVVVIGVVYASTRSSAAAGQGTELQEELGQS